MKSKRYLFVFFLIVAVLAFGLNTRASAQERTITMKLMPDRGELGSVIHVTLAVAVPAGEKAKVSDYLPTGLSYKGNFLVNGSPDIPEISGNVIRYQWLTGQANTVEFDVLVDEAKSWEYTRVYNQAVADWYLGDVLQQTTNASTPFGIYPFEQFKKFSGIAKADVVLLFDLSGSMDPYILRARYQAALIVNEIKTIITDVNFGVTSIVDYPHDYISCGYAQVYGNPSWGDYAYKTNLDITSDTAAVISTLNGLRCFSGADAPQNYSRGLYESQFLSWRPDAVRLIIVFGDGQVHDCDFYLYSAGGDPGRDEIMETADDLDFQTVVAQLATAKIKVLAVNCDQWEGWSVKSFKYMAEQTGGEYFPLGWYGYELLYAIREIVKAEAASELTVEEQTPVKWPLIIQVSNPYNVPISNVVVEDSLGGNLKVEQVISYDRNEPVVWAKGKTEKVFLTWEVGTLNPREAVTLIFVVATDKNPAGKQEYTSPGIYELNSGAKIEFLLGTDRMSAYTDSILITVIPKETQ